MITVVIKCNICVKKIKDNLYINCCICNGKYHNRCLQLNQNDTSIHDTTTWYCHKCLSDNMPFVNIFSSDDFYDALAEFWRKKSKFTIDDLRSKSFNPFELSEHDHFEPLADIDPDSQYYNQLSSQFENCDYYLEDEFIKKCVQKSVKSKNVSVMQFNIRSAKKNIVYFQNFLESLNILFGVIGLSETWFNEYTCDLYCLDGYELVGNHRDHKRGGCVAIMVRNDYVYDHRKDLDVMEEHIEGVFIEIEKFYLNQDKNIIIGSLYRPPNTCVNTYNAELTKILGKIQKENKKCYLMGDFNLNLLKIDEHLPTSEFLELMHANHFYPIINKPTRITENSATLIDNIFCNSLMNASFQGVFYCDISDHFPIFNIEQNTSNTIESDTYIMKRMVNKKAMTLFLHRLKSISWTHIFENNCTVSSFNTFYEAFTKEYDLAFPIKRIRLKCKANKSWVTDSLAKCLKKNNKLYKMFKRHPTTINKIMYQKYKSKLSGIMKKAEKDHVGTMFEQCKGNLSKSWKIIKHLINQNSKTKKVHNFIIKDNLVSDRKVIAKGFNDFFTNIGPNLANKIKPTNIDPISYIPNQNQSSIFLTPVTEQEILNIISEMKNSAAGWDGITAGILKECKLSIAAPLTYICNLSLMQGIFPSQLKIAKVLPFLKQKTRHRLATIGQFQYYHVFQKYLKK